MRNIKECGMSKLSFRHPTFFLRAVGVGRGSRLFPSQLVGNPKGQRDAPWSGVQRADSPFARRVLRGGETPPESEDSKGGRQSPWHTYPLPEGSPVWRGYKVCFIPYQDFNTLISQQRLNFLKFVL